MSSSGSSSSSSPFTLINDQDSQVTYSGTWPVGGTSHEYDGTVTSSVNVGDSFTVSFSGTSIAVFGTFDSGSAGVQTSYAIDGASPTTVTSTSSPNDSYQRLFWQSNAISSGSHKLIVTMLKVNTGLGAGEGTIWFDYFNVTDTGVAVSSPSVSASASSKSSTGKGTSTAKSAGASSTSNVNIPVATKKSSHTGVIAGVVIALIVVMAFVGFILRYRRRQRYNPSTLTREIPPSPKPRKKY
ncbi:hypothetical protein C8F04DRAFT_185654 [Mycena alexandri]|uniref:Uncharacterized protein n=1 Tax=Mycena alexandri TaxID=1745969 RepID=A0AAD6T859_9AGAR|nr:hypothetical protein C8F04DRAFT_185654 [Mycena alexandri]